METRYSNEAEAPRYSERKKAKRIAHRAKIVAQEELRTDTVLIIAKGPPRGFSNKGPGSWVMNWEDADKILPNLRPHLTAYKAQLDLTRDIYVEHKTGDTKLWKKPRVYEVCTASS